MNYLLNPVFLPIPAGRLAKILFLCGISSILLGCSSFGKGVAEVVFEKTANEDTRVCQILGDEFEGLEAKLSKPEGKLKVLMVHGVGDRLPGYSTEFLEKLTDTLGLSVHSHSKDISLTSPEDDTKSLGNLRITRLMSENRRQEMLFYELTWSAITRKQKKLLGFDNSGEYSFRRAEVNDLLKKFTNDTGPDPIIYLGDSRQDILKAFAQSFCWMVKGDWQDLPNNGKHACTNLTDTEVHNVVHDDYAFISHSLGSRITIDGLQHLVALSNHQSAAQTGISPSNQLQATFQNKQIPIFMLSNQLPMLQLGREMPKISGQKAAYCDKNGAHYAQRAVAETSILAFSDPNDLLSYAIPPGFSEEYLDSRLCVNVTNININIATVFDVFGLGKIANPLDAHLGYTKDDRVINLIAHGLGQPKTAPLVKQKCKWTRLEDD